MIQALQTLVDNGLRGEVLDTILIELIMSDNFENDDDRRTCIAFAWHRDNVDKAPPDSCSFQYEKIVKVDGAEYLVLTDEEAEDAFDDYLESCLDDEGVVPGGSGPYFDRNAWKLDAKIDGRGTLAAYDNAEQEYDAHGEWWYLYRIN